MKTRKPMTKDIRSQAGFTLIELMIVIAIIGILAAVAIPNFLRARNQSLFSACLETLASIKVAEEMYIVDNPHRTGTYTTVFAFLTPYMTATCTNIDGTGVGCEDANGNNLVELKVTNNCDGGNGAFTPEIRFNNANTSVVAFGASRDRDQCAICVGASANIPETYSVCLDGDTISGIPATKGLAHPAQCDDL